MFFQLAATIVAFASFWTTATGTVNGPSSLYTLLNGQTFNPPGYTIVMYQSCVQNQNAGNPCGTFSGYQSSNGQYTYQLYGPEAAVSPTCSRTFHLTLACGPTMAMSGVNENPTCVYSATLSLPQVCGVDLTVGNEIASVSPTVLPPTSTTTLTATPSTTSTGTLTGTPLFMVTAWPSTTSTSTLTATPTPLFMITAWPTTSPVNVSATSTPLFYYTAYPSVGSNSTGGGLLGFATSMISSGSTTSVIIGSVALGIVGIGAAAWAVRYFRNGGTVGGLINKIKAEKGNISKFANALPISGANKALLSDPSSLIPDQAHAALDQAQALRAQALHSLPPELGSMVNAKEQSIRNLIQQKRDSLLSFAPIAVSPSAVEVSVPEATATESTTAAESIAAAESTATAVAESIAATVATAAAVPEAAHIVVNSNDVEAIQAFLEQRKKEAE